MRLHKPVRAAAIYAAVASAGFGLISDAVAQGSSRWVISPQLSLAWWQFVPDLSHLWATTCPRDPSWQPGEGRSAGWIIDYAKRPELRESGVGRGRINAIPLFPRAEVNPVCSPAVRGSITIADPERWEGIRGVLVVNPDSLITGNEWRDRYAREKLMQTDRYPEMRFRIDSLRVAETGDTIRGTVFGMLEIRGGQQAITAPTTAWRDGGGLRVQSQFFLPAKALSETFGMSARALGLGIGLRVWEEVHMGVDVVLLSPRGGQSAVGPGGGSED